MMDKKTTKCKWCGAETYILETKECNVCWELRSRIEVNMELSKRMIVTIEQENKVSKCPKCGKEIKVLREHVSGVMHYIRCVGDRYEEVGFSPDEDVEEFRCPICDEVLFDHQPIEAAKFLRGE